MESHYRATKKVVLQFFSMNSRAKNIMRPLYIWAFVEALIFWYAIEKILWSESGITAQQIIVLGIVAQSSQVFIEVPSSVIADRWSRRKSLIASSVFMLLCICVVLSARSFASFAFMSLLWAVYFSLQSGTVNAYIYDLLKEKGEEAQYRKALSRYASFQVFGLLVSSLGASLFVEAGNYLTPYLATIPPTLLAIGILWKMPEPALERSMLSQGTMASHIKSARNVIAAKRWLGFIFVALGCVIAGRFLWYEYYQLFSLERGMAPIVFGLLLAMIHIGNIVGSEFAHRTENPNRVLRASLALALSSTMLLMFVSAPLGIVACLAVCFVGSQAATIVLDESLQHETPSELRATTLSLASLLSRVIFAFGALVIILLDSRPSAIALVIFFIFLAIFTYLPSRHHLANKIKTDQEPGTT